MGLDIYFSFYKKKDITTYEGKPAVLVEPMNSKELNISDHIYNVEEHYLNICGRCEVTDRICDFCSLHNRECEEGYYAKTLLTSSELGQHVMIDSTVNYNKYGWKRGMLFYHKLEDLEECLDFPSICQERESTIERLKEEIKELDLEIDNIRTHQEKAQTKVAFDGFQEQIEKYKEEKSDTKGYLKEVEEGDYDFTHAQMLNDDIQEIKRIMKEYPEVIITIDASY